MTVRRSLLAGFLTIVVGLILLFPARVAYHGLLPDMVRLSGISGSIWNGNATDAYAAGFYLRDLGWRFRPTSIASGHLAWAVQARPMSGFVEGTVGIAPSGTVSLRDVSASLPLELLREAIGNASLSGALNVQIQRLDARNGIPVAADGSFEVANLLDPRLFERSLGGYRGRAETMSDGVLVTYEDTDGLIDIDGRIMIAPDGTYRHTAKLRSKSNTPARIGQFVAALPRAADGSDWHEYLLGEGSL